MGLHRFYLKSWWGFVFIPFFLAILYCNGEVRDSPRGRLAHDRGARAGADGGQARAADRRRRADAPRSARRSPTRRPTCASTQAEYDAAKAVQDHWKSIAARLAIVRRGAAASSTRSCCPAWCGGAARKPTAAGYAADPVDARARGAAAGHGRGPDAAHAHAVHRLRSTGSTSGPASTSPTGRVIAVFVYYYEVLARFVFNSPTNWVHESMFLMFGMQYMLSGAYAYREDQHVRVDVFYSKFSPRGKAIADIVTSVFFFIFTVTMLVDRLALRRRRRRNSTSTRSPNGASSTGR